MQRFYFFRYRTRTISSQRRFFRSVIISAATLACCFPISAFATTVYITSGTTWTVPSDWNSGNNTIEVIGGGVTGGTGVAGGGLSGGGGGAYAKTTNLTLTPSASVSISVGAGASALGTAGDTYFNGASLAASSVGAKGGSGTAGGSAAASIGTTKYSGGSGGSASWGGGGGGGAAGPNGAGANGGSVAAGDEGGGGGGGNGGGTSGGGSTATTGGNGGNNSGATGGGAGAAANGNGSNGASGGGGGGSSQTTTGVGAGGTGGSGIEWDSSNGSGGGGGGGGGSADGSSGVPSGGVSNGGGGGVYGGGGGGGGGSAGQGGNTGGVGGQGIIVVTYMPTTGCTAPCLTFTRNVTVAGNASVTGSVSKGSGTFIIDHPLDPKNKLLYHSFVESPDVMNIYDGIVTLDKNGEATIVLPDYFMALNKDFRYLTTPMFQPMPNLFIKTEVYQPSYITYLFGFIPSSSPQFVIAGGAPNGRVSWQVTGIRHDPLIEQHPIIPEVKKDDTTVVPKGVCLFKPLCL